MNVTFGKKLLRRPSSAAARLPQPRAFTELFVITTSDLLVRREKCEIVKSGDPFVYATQQDTSHPWHYSRIR
jgi:hypothetical protein